MDNVTIDLNSKYCAMDNVIIDLNWWNFLRKRISKNKARRI